MSCSAGCTGIGACRALLPISTQTSVEVSDPGEERGKGAVLSVRATDELAIVLCHIQTACEPQLVNMTVGPPVFTALSLYTRYS